MLLLLFNLIFFNHGCQSLGNGSILSRAKYTLGYPLPNTYNATLKNLYYPKRFDIERQLFFMLNMVIALSVIAMLLKQKVSLENITKSSIQVSIIFILATPILIITTPLLVGVIANIIPSLIDLESPETSRMKINGVINRILFTFLLGLIIYYKHKGKTITNGST